MIRPVGPIRALLVVVPVRDEEERIGACLDALVRAAAEVARQRGRRWPLPRIRLVAVLDRCTDGSAAQIAARPVVQAVTSQAGRVGAARALGVQVALAGEMLPRDQIWLATTDADSRVPVDWLTHQLDLAAAGADLFRGLVEPDPAECGASVYAEWARTYQRRDGHPHVHGASLGVRGDAYELCGGFDPLADADEDLALSRIAANRSMSVVASAQARVATSGRLRSRVEGPGFATYLAALAALDAAPTLANG